MIRRLASNQTVFLGAKPGKKHMDDKCKIWVNGRYWKEIAGFGHMTALIWKVAEQGEAGNILEFEGTVRNSHGPDRYVVFKDERLVIINGELLWRRPIPRSKLPRHLRPKFSRHMKVSRFSAAKRRY